MDLAPGVAAVARGGVDTQTVAIHCSEDPPIGHCLDGEDRISLDQVERLPGSQANIRPWGRPRTGAWRAGKNCSPACVP